MADQIPFDKKERQELWMTTRKGRQEVIRKTLDSYQNEQERRVAERLYSDFASWIAERNYITSEILLRVIRTVLDTLETYTKLSKDIGQYEPPSMEDLFREAMEPEIDAPKRPLVN